MKKNKKRNNTPRNFTVVLMIEMSSAAKGAHKDKSKYTRKAKHKKSWD